MKTIKYKEDIESLKILLKHKDQEIEDLQNKIKHLEENVLKQTMEIKNLQDTVRSLELKNKLANLVIAVQDLNREQTTNLLQGHSKNYVTVETVRIIVSSTQIHLKSKITRKKYSTRSMLRPM